MVDRLLASPHYGERWGRYWLDVARYADTKGYVFQEERHIPYAYTYRDCVIHAFNDDLPYDQFLIEQIAADQLAARRRQASRWRRWVSHARPAVHEHQAGHHRRSHRCRLPRDDGADRRLRPLPRSQVRSDSDQGLLLALRGLQQQRRAEDPPLIGEPEHNAAYEAFDKELAKRQGEYDKFVGDKVNEMAAELRSAKSIADYLAATTIQGRREQLQTRQDINRFVLSNGELISQQKATEKDSIFAAWRLYASIPESEFADKSSEVTEQIANGDPAASDSSAGREGVRRKSAANHCTK